MVKLVMGPLNWVIEILDAVAITLVAEKKVAELSIVFFVGILVALLVFYRNKILPISVVRILEICAPTLVGNEKATRLSREVEPVNDSLYQLHPLPYKADNDPNLQVLFFHGLLLGNTCEMHLSTWQNEDGCLWPKTWLREEFPDAQILVVSYVEGLRKGSAERFNMDVISENLILDLIQAGIGQKPYCPVVLVGHSFGGLVIKKLCMEAHYTPIRSSQGSDVKNFLGNLRGIFYYSTPHRGSNSIDKAEKVLKGPLFKYFKSLSTEAAQLNHKFDNLRNSSYQKWQIEGLGEGCAVKSGPLKGYVVVPEASARDGERFYFESTADHFSICRPNDKTSSRFKNLTTLLHRIDDTMKEEKKKADEIRKKEEALALKLTRRQDLQEDVLDRKVIGIEIPLKEIKVRLEKFQTLGLIGMGGVGKSTLAKVIFNEVSPSFEYTCFFDDLKLLGSQCNLQDEVWKRMHHNGRRVVKTEDWSDLKGKGLLLVLDDILGDRDITFITNKAKLCSPESRFIVTTRDSDKVSKSIEDMDIDIYEVPFLDEENSKELFVIKAFPNEKPIHEVVSVMEKIVRKCDGLPLTLTVIGSYLRRGKEEDIDAYVEKWLQTLNALDQAGQVKLIDEKLWAKLRVSYNSLGETEKQIFLDATTFFYHQHWTPGKEAWTLREAKAAWREAYGTKFERLLWETLIDRCLVYDVGEDEQIKVHEQLLSLGRKIASESENNGRIRVWNKTQSEILTLLQNNDESDNKEFHALILPYHATIPDNALHRLKNLRYLAATNFGYKFGKSFPSELVVLKCRGLQHLHDFLPAGLRGHLAVLKLYEVGFLPRFIGQCASLRILKFQMGTLDSLRSSQIESQQIIPNEVGDLRQLEYLSLKICFQLQTLPEKFGNLFNLRVLKISHCPQLRFLHESFGRLSSLRQLRLKECPTLIDLPESLGELASLERLELRGCERLHRLPDSFGNLSNLKHLRISRCDSIEVLPKSFSQLLKLTHLELTDCGNWISLISFGQFADLQYLKLGGKYDIVDLDKLPDAIGELKALHHLILFKVSIKTIPNWIKTMQALHILELGQLPFLQDLPSWLGEEYMLPLALSDKVFHVQDGLFTFAGEKTETSAKDLVKSLHEKAVKLVEKSDYERALQYLCPYNVGELQPEDQWFFLQERGIAKRFKGDLYGALEDLTSAEIVLSKAYNRQDLFYGIWKHRGYVNFLLGNLIDAEKDGAMALNVLPEYKCDDVLPRPFFKQRTTTSTLGEKSVACLRFRLGTRLGFELDELSEPTGSANSQVMEKVRESNFKDALACWDVIDTGASSSAHKVFFLQERGVLMQMTGDLHGALKDFTAALEICGEENYLDGVKSELDYYTYNCWKHRGLVNFKLGNLDKAQNDGATALKVRHRLLKEEQILKREIPQFPSDQLEMPSTLGEEPVEYLHFKLVGLTDSGHRGFLYSSRKKLKEKLSVSDFPGALAIWDDVVDVDRRVSCLSDWFIFLVQRGTLKRLAGDLLGALGDFTTALEIIGDSEDVTTAYESLHLSDSFLYECLKQRGFVN